MDDSDDGDDKHDGREMFPLKTYIHSPNSFYPCRPAILHSSYAHTQVLKWYQERKMPVTPVRPPSDKFDNSKPIEGLKVVEKVVSRKKGRRTPHELHYPRKS